MDPTAWLEPLPSGVRWEDLRLPESSRLALTALAERGARGVVALFSGPRSTGKSVAAAALAARLGRDAYRIDMTRVVSTYIGETEKNIERVFADARAAGSVLFFDEADALIGKRSGVRDAHDRYANQEIAYLLQRIEAHAGVVILATNLKQDIAPAVVKRSQATVAIPRRMS